MQRLRILCLAAVLSFCCSQSICFGERWVGFKVLPFDFAAPIKDGDRTIGALTDFDWPRTVEKENGDWIWLSDTKVKGWVQKNAVESVDDFLRRRTEEIQTNPTCWSYNWRGIAWNSKGKHDLAIKDYSKAQSRTRAKELTKTKGTVFGTGENPGSSRATPRPPSTT